MAQLMRQRAPEQGQQDAQAQASPPVRRAKALLQVPQQTVPLRLQRRRVLARAALLA
jgi:hypothetical protein